MTPESVADCLCIGETAIGAGHSREAFISLLTECLPNVRQALRDGKEVLPQFITSAYYVAYSKLVYELTAALANFICAVAQGPTGPTGPSSSIYTPEQKLCSGRELKQYTIIIMDEIGHPYESIFERVLADAERITNIDIDEPFVNEPHQVSVSLRYPR